MSGRGYLFGSSSSGSASASRGGDESENNLSRQIKDSGVSSKDPSQNETLDLCRSFGRGMILTDNLAEQTRSICGRGIYSSDEQSSEGRGSGRGFVFKNVHSLASSSGLSMFTELPKAEVKNPETQNKPLLSSNTTSEADSQVRGFYKPSNIHGTKGTPLNVKCNYIRLSCDPKKGVFMYEVRFQPNIDSLNLRLKYLNEHRDKLGGTKTFDGVTLYLPIMLDDETTVLQSQSLSDKDSTIELRIIFKRKEIMKNCIHLYNVLFSRVMKTLNYVRIDRKQFDPTAPKVIPHAKLEVWPGYVTAVDEYEDGLMLMCDVSHRVLCQTSVLEKLVEIYRTDHSRFQETARKCLLGSVVITHYNNQTYRIDEIYFDKSPNEKFESKNGPISFVDYYRQHYSIEIKDRNQPLLASIRKVRGPDGKKCDDQTICLIPEICHLTGLTDAMREDNKLMREIATHTRISPNSRLLALHKFYNNVQNCEEARKILSNWGLTLKSDAETVISRKLKEEEVCFAHKSFGVGPNADFSRYAVNNELIDVKNLINWLVIYCKVDGKVFESFTEHICRNSNAMGMIVKKPRAIMLDNDRMDTYVNALRNNIRSDTEIVVCICPKSRDDRYSAIKKICCTEIPVPSQVINARTLLNENKNRSIVQKIALQMNCKMGGSLWSVNIPLKNTMICGIDSYHDAARKDNSVAAFVASLNCKYTQWYSKAVIQTKGEEIVGGLCASFMASLFAYEKYNSKLPDNVIIYRDGVGDGQLLVCANYEVAQLETAFRKAHPNHVCKITFIVVQKRINTRFFLKSGREYVNPEPGTVVDTIVTRKSMYDFFLVPQSVRQGTVTPSHYVVLRDDMNYSPDILQRLTYKLCFLYYNWPGSIRVPACCQYAHKLAYQVGQNIRRTTAEDLSTKLFYL